MEGPESEATRDAMPSSPDERRTLAPSANQQAANLDDVPSDDRPKRMPSLRSVSDPPNMNPNSTTRGVLERMRKPPTPISPAPSVASGGSLSSSFLEKARMFQEGRLKTPVGGSPGPGSNGFAPMPGANQLHRPAAVNHPRSDPLMQSPSLAQRRANKFGMTLSDMGSSGTSSPAPGLKRANAPKLSDIGGPSKTDEGQKSNGLGTGSKLDDFKKYIDADKGWITFDGRATITRTGVQFANGQTFSISLDEIEILGELGKGNYGTVYKVRHAKPQKPRFGHGLSGVRVPQTSDVAVDSASPTPDQQAQDGDGNVANTTTGKTMAMKEIRLELDDAKFTTILKELVILHECVSPHIIDFYGAFFQEGAVYMCIEYMDGGSIDKLYKGGIPEDVLRKITYATVMGLKSLKDEHNIIHRDVKPTNILVNTRGQVKICDFGVSGNLVASIAKTNIGCQSYMAPERISGGGVTASGGGSDGTYSVQSDIWSLGLTIIECAMGKYPYPPEVSSTIFSQLSAIVEGDPPDLPTEGYSETAQNFVSSCLHKIPKMRATYAMLLSHPWLKPLSKPQTIAEVAEEGEEAEKAADAIGRLTMGEYADDPEVAAWVIGALGDAANSDAKSPAAEHDSSRPALHAAPLDTVSPMASPVLTTNNPLSPMA